ncbi:MAG: hypothetical protein HC804_04565 [Anaerolineae bacterium]|nr:hypothetical protein [Anaerolineae bacterium]
MALLDIYEAIAAQSVTMSNGTVINKVWKPDDIKDRVNDAQLPLRILLPPGADGNTAVADFEMVTFRNGRVVWRITELMLYRPIGQGGGVGNVWSLLTDYIARYVSTFVTGRKLASGTVTGFEPQAAVLEWPRGSGNQFHGVQTTLLVSETIC